MSSLLVNSLNVSSIVANGVSVCREGGRSGVG